MVKVSGPAARDLMRKLRDRSEGKTEYQPLETPLAVRDREKSLAAMIRDEGVVRKLERAGIMPVATTLKDRDSVESNLDDLGTILVRRPSAAELMQGFDPDFLILTPATATRSPFGYRPPVDATVFGLSDPRSRVTVAPNSTSDGAILYGDVNDVVNRLVEGGSSLLGKAKEAIDLDKLSPRAKALLGVAAAGGALYTANKLISPFTYMRMGSRMTDDGRDEVQWDVTQLPVESGRISQMLQTNSSMVNPTSDATFLKGTVYPVTNAFWASAYALGDQFAKRKEQPNFGVLVGDVDAPLRQLRSLRCPKLYVSDTGDIIRSSAPYCASWLNDARLSAAKAARDRQPLQGGVLSLLGPIALKAIKKVGGKLLSKLKEVGPALWGKIKKGFKKLFAPHTDWPAKDVAIFTTPIRMAAFIWNKLGTLPSSVVDAIDNMMGEAVDKVMKSKDSTENKEKLSRELAQQILDYAERERLKAGVPSETAWNAASSYISGGGQAASGPQFDVLRQYAERTAENVKQLSSCGSGELVEIFDTRNPVILFSDMDGLEADLRDLLGETDAELERQEPESPSSSSHLSESGVAGIVDTPASNTKLSRTMATSNVPASPVSVEPSASVTDPETFARAIAMTSGVSRPGQNIPQEWIAELPAAAQEAYYGVSEEGTNDPAFVGDVLSPKHRITISRNAELLRDAWRARRELTRARGVLPSSQPMAGVVPFVAAALPALKTFGAWLIPSLLALVDWKNISTWVKKNGAKAKVLLAGGFSRAKLAIMAAKSGGALGAFAKALRTLGSKVTAAGKAVLSFAWRNPKATAILALVSAAWALGTSKTTDGKGYKALIDALTRALREVDVIFGGSNSSVKAHIDALQALSLKTGGQYSEADAEELQACAMTCVLVAAAIRDGSLVTHEEHSALDEVLAAYDKARDSVVAESQQDDWDAMLEVMVAQLTEIGGAELTATGPSTDSATHIEDSLTSTGMSSDTATALAHSLSALGAAGAVSAAARPATADPAPVGISAAQSAESSMSKSDGGGAALDAPASAAQQGDAELVSSLSDAQLEELRTTAQALAMSGARGGDSEVSVVEAGADLAKKWGLGAAGAAAVVALIAALVRARRTGRLGSSSSSILEDAVNWWQSLWRQSSVAEGSTSPSARAVSGVIL